MGSTGIIPTGDITRYQFIVTIPNPPLAIRRHFQCVDAAQADRFIDWLKTQGLTYTVVYTSPATADDAIHAVEREQRLAAEGRVE